MSNRDVLTALVASGMLVLAGCAEPDGADPQAGGAPGSPGVIGTVTVLAAASLTEAFTQIGEGFETAHPEATVSLSFAGSSTLATQINQGAPADVFASASPANMRAVTEAGNADGTATTFARNQLIIAVPAGNPMGVDGLADLTRPQMTVALCAEQVPCGAAAQAALAAAGVPLTPVTLEQNVKAALSKVKLGEVDAALVYRTDVDAAAGEVDGIEFPEAAEAINDYRVVVLADAPNRAGGRAFLAYLQSEPARAALTAAGFQTP